MKLRGFDSYDVRLGDEMRGERASLGKSLEDAERDMRIKARIITAIEDCDLSGFPNHSVISGYVRSYARYLGMDPEECFDRFCHESGYESPSAFRVQEVGRRAHGRGQATRQGPGAQLGQSRFATTAAANNRFMPRVSLGALTSTMALLGLIAGLGYGGYALLQDIQRVGFAPLPQAPSVVAEAPEIGTPDIDTAPIAKPAADDYQGGGILAALAAPVELPPVDHVRRDGPISAIDPAEAGLFARAEPLNASHAAPGPLAAFDDFDVLDADRALQQAVMEAEQGIALHASEKAWIRVREGEGEGAVLFEGTLAAGERYDLPERAAAPLLKAGNAGGIFISVDGVPYGPVGARGSVARDVSLRADDIRSSMPQVEPDALQPAETVSTPQQRAEATLPRN